MKNFIKHDLNARNDAKIENLIMQKGLSGLGAFWCIIEMLHENDGYLDFDCDRIAFALRSDSDFIKSIITEFDLFIFDKNKKKFSNKRALEQVKVIKDISEKARNNANIKWKKHYATAERPQSDRNATAMQGRSKEEEDVKKKKIRTSKPQVLAPEAPGVKKIFEIFYQVNPTLNFGNSTYRKAAEEMIKKFGEETVINAAQKAVECFGKKYAPTISNPFLLKSRLPDLMAYYKKEQGNITPTL